MNDFKIRHIRVSAARPKPPQPATQTRLDGRVRERATYEHHLPGDFVGRSSGSTPACLSCSGEKQTGTSGPCTTVSVRGR